ncbi:helix-turn-helix domain-containing protein [Streptomyces scabiei]|uniref:helix-turn-helix domain-containing protein n=1 Tax=Streptomyces scabiei TaxID=1930 RepID=UPI00131AF83B|nr:helix-turn-helix transcriptional regulator [Streptomyces scabiei]
MTSDGNAPAWHGWIRKQFGSDVSPGRRALAVALGDLCRHLRPDFSGQLGNKELTQTEAAKRLRSNPSSLSRFLSGKTVPGPEFIETLFKEACADTGAGAGDAKATGITLDLDDLMRLRQRAVKERRCDRCGDLSEQTAELTSLKHEAATLRTAVTELRAAKAGLQARPAPPPVPPSTGDRRRSRNDVAAARQVAVQAEELGRGGRQDVALTLLRQTAEVLSPVETAVVLLTLRQQRQNRLADNLIHIYGRDQGDRSVMQVALELHEQGADGDAGAILRAAMR